MLLVSLTTLWGVRLAGYLAWRNHGKGEDSRYQEMREHRGDRILVGQSIHRVRFAGHVMLFVSLPVQMGQVIDADECFQLSRASRFGWLGSYSKRSATINWRDSRLIPEQEPENQSKVMDRGLWRYTRHPNYFGNALIWWGLFLLAVTGSHPWVILSPLLMTFLLVKVSGVALLERSLKSRSLEYRDYVRRTSAFIPWIPKSPSDLPPPAASANDS